MRFMRRPGPMRNVRACLICAIAVLVISASAFAEQAPATDAASRDFEAEIAKYMQLRQNAVGGGQRSTNSSQKLSQHRMATADKLQAARLGAKQGDILTENIAPYFRQQIATTLAGPGGRRIRSTLRHAEPVRTKVQVNQHYPRGLPLQSTPPTLLSNLPPLPKELEYRIVGDDLVLRDVGANLVLD